MFARTTLLEIDTLRTSIDAAVEVFRTEVLPMLEAQPGFAGVYVMSTSAGKGMLVSFWDTAEQADSSEAAGWYSDVLARYATLFRSPPGREHYEVHLAEVAPRGSHVITTEST